VTKTLCELWNSLSAGVLPGQVSEVLDGASEASTTAHVCGALCLAFWRGRVLVTTDQSEFLEAATNQAAGVRSQYVERALLSGLCPPNIGIHRNRLLPHYL
jgi:hypothetical protein